MAAIAVFAAPAAHAEIVTFAGRELSLTPPPGFCAITAAHPIEAAMIQMLEKGFENRNSLLLAFGDCESLMRVRRGEMISLARWGQFLAPLRNGEARAVTSRKRAEAVQELSQALPKIPWADITKEIQQRVESAGTGVQVESVTPLGLLHSDSDAAYLGLLLPVVAPNVDRSTVAGVIAMTLVNQVMLSINLYQPFIGQSTVDALLDDQRRNISALISENDAYARRTGGRDSDNGRSGLFDWRQLIEKAVIGGIAGAMLAAAAFLYRRLRGKSN